MVHNIIIEIGKFCTLIHAIYKKFKNCLFHVKFIYICNLKKKTNFKIPILTSLTFFERNNNHKSKCKKHPANSFPCTIEILIISQGFTEPFILFSERKTNVII
jgi:hypothetical protein